jgi:hypothetical protein
MFNLHIRSCNSNLVLHKNFGGILYDQRIFVIYYKIIYGNERIKKGKLDQCYEIYGLYVRI